MSIRVMENGLNRTLQKLFFPVNPITIAAHTISGRMNNGRNQSPKNELTNALVGSRGEYSSDTFVPKGMLRFSPATKSYRNPFA